MSPRPPEQRSSGGVTLRPRWVWITFGLVALAIPAIGLWMEHAR